MTSTLATTFAPTGKLRASINIGNPVLARAEGDSAAGVSIDIARELGKRLGVETELVVFKTAADSVQALETGRADVGFFAIDPKRGEQIAFTAPYVLIEGAYLVRQESSITSNDEVDKPEHRVVVGQGSAYDLFLSRSLKHARIERTDLSEAVVKTFLETDADVAAGVKQQLQADSADQPGLRMLPGRFMEIRQAMGTPKRYGDEAAGFLRQFVEDIKSRGFVRAALDRHGIEGAAIAPAANPAKDPLDQA
ncbi:MAG: ABC transporter substrate-binding protein [Burkholderiaceae bacterium]|nr:ABC transporter substrate-binding protein [Burkholderiaceae bacterium]MCD8516580.1 ABC transporter substrate-binding protein [Burkholderiaceae bacterium]MCD8537294.1 ABC transporter substrate-binding protein [Burkholderiaceae bacterium]MCD8565196.1 ABC transporter substrate-binding protein [Burkholderiaceae bacterium]